MKYFRRGRHRANRFSIRVTDLAAQPQRAHRTTWPIAAAAAPTVEMSGPDLRPHWDTNIWGAVE